MKQRNLNRKMSGSTTTTTTSKSSNLDTAQSDADCEKVRSDGFADCPFAPGLCAGKVALVTGGGTGIGLAIAEALSILGCTVFIASRKLEVCQDAAQSVNERLESNSTESAGKVIALRCNIREQRSVDLCFDSLLSQSEGRLDYLVNNAGGQFQSAAESISQKGFDTVIDLNLRGTWRVTMTALKRVFKQQKSGSIVNITASFFHGAPFMAHSGAARMGVTSLTVTLSQEWAKYGIRLNSVVPGFIDSTGLQKYPSSVRKMMDVHIMHNYRYRKGRPSEVANAVVFLLSDRLSGFITGHHMFVDGGEHLFNPLCPPQQCRL